MSEYCIGFVYSELKNKQVDEDFFPTLTELSNDFEILPDAKDADALAVYNPDMDAAIHMSIFDKKNKNMVWEIEGIGKEPQNVTIEKATEFYLSLSPKITIKYLKNK